MGKGGGRYRKDGQGVEERGGLVPRVVGPKALPKVEFPACRPIATVTAADGQQATAIGCA